MLLSWMSCGKTEKLIKFVRKKVVKWMLSLEWELGFVQVGQTVSSKVLEEEGMMLL